MLSGWNSPNSTAQTGRDTRRIGAGQGDVIASSPCISILRTARLAETCNSPPPHGTFYPVRARGKEARRQRIRRIQERDWDTRRIVGENRAISTLPTGSSPLDRHSLRRGRRHFEPTEFRIDLGTPRSTWNSLQGECAGKLLGKERGPLGLATASDTSLAATAGQNECAARFISRKCRKAACLANSK
jgi:hypothetical protein